MKAIIKISGVLGAISLFAALGLQVAIVLRSYYLVVSMLS